MKAYQRFLEYVKVDTTSNPKSKTHPSSPGQIKLGKMLVAEMKQIGIANPRIDQYGYVYGLIPANTKKKLPTIGFIAHLDTSKDMSGANINPRIIENYNGENVELNENCILDVDVFPFLKDLKGRSLIVTDGTTLLGADNKAGVAEIMTLAEILLTNPNIEHGEIKIAFTPDEEIGKGTMFFDLENFQCDYAYTVDGGEEGSIEYENFNAASATVTINGVNIHPGDAKGKMVNSIEIGYEFHQLLPQFLKPAFTENYEGFNHLHEISGNVEKTILSYLIRNHDLKLFNKQKQDFLTISNFINQKYGPNTCEVEIEDTYYNMYEYIKEKFEIVELAERAIKNVGLTPIVKPIRGGTDGAMLTSKGLPCPNLGTGGYNFHGRFECITIEGMDTAVAILLEIVREIAKG